MELRDYVNMFWKRAWLFMLLGALAGAICFAITSRQTPKYEAKATISVGGSLQARNPSTDQINAGMVMAQAYAVLATTDELLDKVIDLTQVQIAPGKLRKDITITIVPQTSLIDVSVKHEDPEAAATLANEIARELVEQSPNSLTADQQEQLDRARATMQVLDDQLREAQQQLDDIDQQLDRVTGDTDRVELMTERNLVITHMDQVMGNQAQFMDIITSMEQSSNYVQVIDQASIPSDPVSSNQIMFVFFSIVAGVAVAAMIAVVLEYMDTQIKTPQQVPASLKLPVLAAIPRFRSSGWRNHYKKCLITVRNPFHPASERYRTLSANLLLGSNSHNGNGTRKAKVFVMTSPNMGEGKSVTAANLAVALASAKMRVLLIDADLRRPTLYKIFGLRQHEGLIQLLRSEPSNPRQNPAELFDKLVQKTSIPGLRVITSGGTCTNPMELLGSPAMQKLIELIQTSPTVDVILFDSPPRAVGLRYVSAGGDSSCSSDPTAARRED